MKRLLAIGLSLVFVLGSTACGGGEDTGQQQSSATGQKAATSGPQVDVSDSELRSFIQASLQLESFRQEMRSRMQEASGQEEGQEVREQLMLERDSIVEAAGLSGTARYDTIMEAIKTSERLRKRYTSLRDSMEADSAAADTAS
mgnify:FL=1